MNKKVRLAGALGALTTASIAITAFTLPQFNSLDSYLYRPTNWTEAFASKQAAIDYLNEQGEEFFSEDISGRRTVNQYAVTAALNGLNNSFFADFNSDAKMFDDLDENLDAEELYKQLKTEFMTEMTNHLVSQIASKATNAYTPLNDIVNGGAFVSDAWSSDISEYYKGHNDLSFTSLESAFTSLIDQSQIVFDYDGVNYDTVDEVILAWMSNVAHDFTNDNAFKAVLHHLKFDANHVYKDSYGYDHHFFMSDDNKENDDLELFKKSVENAFYNEMVNYETYTSHTYNINDWLGTPEYIVSRDSWMASNTVSTGPLLNQELRNNTMAEAIGLAVNTEWPDYIRSIDGPGNDFLSSWSSKYNNSWPEQKDIDNGEQKPNLPDVSNKISTNLEFTQLSLFAGLTTTMNDVDLNSVHSHLAGVVNNICAGGTSNKNTEEWKSWQTYGEFMGFDNIVIEKEDRIQYSNNTVNEWWQMDCEGTYVDQGIEHSNDNAAISWFSNEITAYFDLHVDPIDHILNNFLGGNDITGQLFFSNGKRFTFSSNVMGGALTGKTMIQALFEGGNVSASEEDYKNSGYDFTNDYTNWVNDQDFIIYWGIVEVRERTEALAIASVNAQIRAKIEAEYLNIIYDEYSETKYDIADTHVDAILAVDPTIKTKDYNSIAEARESVNNSVISNGNNNIWIEKGIVNFLDNSDYNFDTTIDYNSVQEAWFDVNWDIVAARITSASGQSALFTDLIEYSTSKYMILAGFNGSVHDFAFDMSANDLGKRLIEGYDLSSLDSSIDYIDAVVSEAAETGVTYELVTHKISLAKDNYDNTKTTWFETDEALEHSEDEIKSIEAARKELIQYWKDYIGA